MRYSFIAFGTELRRYLFRPRFWVFLLLTAAAAACLHMLPWRGEGSVVTVGVAAPQGQGKAFLTQLESRSGELVCFCPSDENEIVRRVAASQWDCGLILCPDFDQRMNAGEYEGLITLVTGPGSAVYPLVRETVTAAVLELAAPGIAMDYLVERLQVSGEEQKAAASRLEEILPKDQRVEIVPVTADGRTMEPLELAGAGVERAACGVLAVLLLIWALSAGVDLGRWKQSGEGMRLLAVRSPWEVLLPRLAAWMTPVLLVSGAALLVATGSWLSAAMLLPYLLALGGITLLLARGRVWRILPVLLPFAAAVGMLLSPVFVDVTMLVPGLSPLSAVMPVTLYLEGCAGQYTAALKLVGMALLMAILGGAPIPRLSRRA